MILLPMLLTGTLACTPAPGGMPASNFPVQPGPAYPIAGAALQQAATTASPEQASKWSGTAEAYYLFLQASQLESDGDLDGAVKLYQQAAGLDPGACEIPAALSELYARQDRAREAIDSAESALKINAGCLQAHYVLGSIYAVYAQLQQPGAPTPLALQYAEKAIPHLEAVEQGRGDTVEPGVLLTLGRLYMKTAAPDKAIAVLRRLAEQQPDALDAVVSLADAYVDAGRPDDATELLSRAAMEEPTLYPKLAEVYEHAGRWSEAADSYSKAVAAGVDGPDLKKRWALALLNTGRQSDAERARSLLEEVLGADQNDVSALYLLAQAQRQTRDFEAAEATARKLMALDPQGASGPYALAQVFEQQHAYERVVETLQPLVDRLTEHGAAAGRTVDMTPILLHLGFAYLDLQKPDKAIPLLERARQSSPDESTIAVGLVQAQILAKQYARAIDEAGKARTMFPEDVRLERLQADALRLDNQVDKAVALLEDVLRAHPEDVSNHMALAELLINADRTEEALKVLKAAESKFPSDETVLFEMGAAYERQKRYGEAEAALRKVIAKDPSHAQALNYLGYMLADRGVRLSESVGYIQRALKIDPGNPAYLDSLGWAYFKMNRLDLAEKNLREAAAARSSDSAVQDHWGDLLFRLGRSEDAIVAWQRALSGDGESIDRSSIESKIRTAQKKLARK
jgi:tetratricopeptide (TPR) repeat protein